MSTAEQLSMAAGLGAVIRAQRSVRVSFCRSPYKKPMLDKIFTLAQFPPSNCNVQPWVPHVVSGHTLARLRPALPEAGIPTSKGVKD